MAERAAHLVEHVFPPDVPVRQWVLWVPHRLRYRRRRPLLAPAAVVSWSGETTIQAGACDFRMGSVLREASATAAPHFLYLDCTGASTFAGAVTTLGAGILVSGDGPCRSRAR